MYGIIQVYRLYVRLATGPGGLKSTRTLAPVAVRISGAVSPEDTSEEEEEISEEELALVTRRIRKLLLQSKKFILRKNFRKENGESSKKEVIICYECNKPSHYKVDCPKLKKPIKKFKKKAFKAIWDESSDTEEEDVGDEVANMCFMALEESSDEVTTLDDTTLCDDVVEFSYDELVGALKLINDELEKSHKKNQILKCQLGSLKRESENSPKESLPSNDGLQKSLDELSLENKNLKNEILELKNSLSKFLKANSSKTIFVKATNLSEPKISSSNRNIPKTSSSNVPKRNAHVHQSINHNAHIRHTPRQFAYKRNDHYRAHISSLQNHHTHHISCSHAYNRQGRNGYMRTQTHSLTYGPRTRRFNGHCHYCGKFGHTNYRCTIRKVHLGYGSIWKLKNEMTNPQGSKYIWVCLISSKIESKWYLDSGCSKHMTGNSSHFISLEKKDDSGQIVVKGSNP
ncbi:hypothetical protein MANES_17G026529v8 [Manihot esculenta]|uniref:Uncharacterized protein n=1 Tax=Manihot esculenta TaxID=3983 RepID=A0ACB7G281_MANES|nr:hypothetical protein MANES_17G026529v8 [Manihot esculenta]